MDAENIARVRAATKQLREALRALDHGPLDFYLTELIAAHDLLMTRFAPFKPGDRVALTRTPVINGTHSWGWLPWKDRLIDGAEAVVVDGGCGTGGFYFGVTFDGIRGEFRFSEADLRLLAPTPPGAA